MAWCSYLNIVEYKEKEEIGYRNFTRSSYLNIVEYKGYR